MKWISPDDAFLLLAKWKEERVTIQAELSRPAMQHAGAAVVSGVLPNSQKVLLVLHDENGEDVHATVSLEGAAWAYDDSDAVRPEGTNSDWSRSLRATFPNGNHCVFGKRATLR